ncbi:MAG: transglutaminase family protein [Acidobacteria bacterium]|nr:transglutaminase family protein [Acidobacteriota bacterium]
MIIFPFRFASGDEIIVSGEHTVSFFINSAEYHEFRDYSNNGYSQTVEKIDSNKYRIEINTSRKDLESLIKFPLEYKTPEWLRHYLLPTKDTDYRKPEIRNLAQKLSKGCVYQYQVVENIIRWINTNIKYELTPGGPTSAEDVLREKTGYCVGFSNLAVALLRALDIPARNIHGIYYDYSAVDSTKTEHLLSLDGVTLHRWIEVYYPDVGWVFSDPRKSINHVDSNYIFIAPQNGGLGLDSGKFIGLKVSLQKDDNNLIYLDLIQVRDRMLFIRPNLFQRINSAVIVWLLNKAIKPESIEIVLASLDHVLKSTPEREKPVRFIGLPNGEYELKIRYDGTLKYINKFSLQKMEELRFDIMLELEGEANEEI